MFRNKRHLSDESFWLHHCFDSDLRSRHIDVNIRMKTVRGLIVVVLVSPSDASAYCRYERDALISQHSQREEKICVSRLCVGRSLLVESSKSVTFQMHQG